MNPTIDIVRAELERIFSLDEMTSMSQRLLSLDPEEVGGSSAKATFAKALTERCLEDDRFDALIDVLLASRLAVDPRVRDAASLSGRDEVPVGQAIGPFTVTRKIGEGPLGIVYLVDHEGVEGVLKVLKREACRDRRAVQRFLTANRMVAALDQIGLPMGLEAGESGGSFWIRYDHEDAQPLSVRFGRTGPVPIGELRPILRGILEPLAAMHRARIAHGDLKLENVLVGRESPPQVTLIDFGTDRLRQGAAVANGHSGVLAVFGSPKTIAPEQVRGQRADAASDVYAFGAMMYELLSGSPVFGFDSATDAAFAHLNEIPEPPSVRGPRGLVARDVDAMVLSLLAKDPAKRPRDASVLLDMIEAVGRGPASIRAPAMSFSEDDLTVLVDSLIAAPDDPEAAAALEDAVDQGADPAAVAEGFEIAARGVAGDGEETVVVRKNLLRQAARIFDASAGDKERAEAAYQAVLDLDAEDPTSHIELEAVRKALGKYGDVVESLIARSESAAPGQDRARIFAEIGRLCAYHLDDPDQGILAYARALCETPLQRDLADEIERLAEGKPPLWNEVLATVTEGIHNGALSSAERSKLLAYAGRWYEDKLGRPDLAQMAFRQILATDAESDEAHDGLTRICRHAQQWPELVTALLARADAAAGSPRSRDFRAEAAEVLAQKLNDSTRASEIYKRVLDEDPGHLQAAEGMSRIAEAAGDYKTLASVLDGRAESESGHGKAQTLVSAGEVYEQNLEDVKEAEARYQAALAADPNEMEALRGLDRIYNRAGRYRELLENFEKQIAQSGTPRQKVNVYERMAVLYDEEFLDHARAAECLEEILAIDPANESALSKLPRFYRVLGEWDALEKLYERHARTTSDDKRRLELLMQRGRVLAENVGSPDRATEVYELALSIDPEHKGALEALARLRAQTGDAEAALKAIETLAGSATTAQARGEQWLRAAKLLEDRGDHDGAIERYKLAVEANPTDTSAAAALRNAYAERGDATGVVVLIESELSRTEGKVARARLYGELARVQRDKLHDDEEAESNAKAAIDLDPTNADAHLVLGDIAFEAERYVEASKHLEPLAARAMSLPQEDAVRVLVRFAEAFGRGVLASRGTAASAAPSQSSLATGQPRLAQAVDTLEKIAADDADALGRVARILFECGDLPVARRLYQTLLDAHGDDLPAASRADAQWRLGESLRRLGELGEAVDLLRAAADTDPNSAQPLNALARVYEQTGDWEEFVRTKRRRLEMAAGAERFELLMEIGDAEFKRLGDRQRAAKTYLAALDERPDDRKLLTKMMELFTEEKDWASLVEVVLRLADFVDDPKQRAKYMHTAAKVTARQLGEVDKAIGYYARTLESDPTLAKATDEAIELYRQKGDFDGVERLLNTQLEQAKRAQDTGRMVQVLDHLGELYAKSLNEPELAIDAYEAAQAFEPEAKERTEVLAELYASDVTKYLDKAVKAQAEILARNPMRAESYKLLRRLYTESRRPDPAWCLCQALSVLGLAEADEERFYQRFRADNAAPAQDVLSEQDWVLRLAHEDSDPIVTHIFAHIQPTIIRARTQSLEALGYDPAYRLELAEQPYAVCQTLHYAGGVLGFEPPPVFQNPNDPAGLGFVHAHTPAIVLGRAAFEGEIPNQSLAFIAGRHLTYFRPGYYVRHLVPTGTGLKGWLFAAIKHCVPQFPIAQELQGQVTEALTYMQRDFQGVQREILASLVSKLLQSGGAIDLKKWVAAIDLTADRAGLVLAHDLAVARDVIGATDDASSVPSKERIKEVVLYSVSTPYLELREKLAITVDS